MIQIHDKTLCTGCGGCASICPVNAIVLTEDQEGFRYPLVNTDICVNCGKCNHVCPMIQQNNREKETECFYAGYLKDKESLQDVSSGGVFWALALTVLAENGVVYGAVHSGIEDVHHERAETVEEAAKFRRSKYFQSVVGNCYAKVREDLNEGRQVLFSGTPCQIAALYAFLGEGIDGLYTCEVVCHGVPSMKAFHSWRVEEEKRHGSKIVGLIFRDKSDGWKQNHYAVTFSDGTVSRKPSVNHDFHRGYLQGLFYRPSCGKCRYACMPRFADITLADFWKYNGALHAANEDKGISLIVCSTSKGKQLVDRSAKLLEMEQVDRKTALDSCRHLWQHPQADPKRGKFFEILDKKGFEKAMHRCMPRPSISQEIGYRFYKLKMMLGRK